MKHCIEFLRTACLVGLLGVTGAALADKPSWAGGDKHTKGAGHGEVQAGQGAGRDRGAAAHFDDDFRQIVVDYYGGRAKAGKCPPGLAKKNSGCLPPGQAKKWNRGQPLPADLRQYDLPHELLRRLPPPPPEHRYVRIAGDVLMIAVGTRMVIDAIEDILR